MEPGEITGPQEPERVVLLLRVSPDLKNWLKAYGTSHGYPSINATAIMLLNRLRQESQPPA